MTYLGQFACTSHSKMHPNCQRIFEILLSSSQMLFKERRTSFYHKACNNKKLPTFVRFLFCTVDLILRFSYNPICAVIHPKYAVINGKLCTDKLAETPTSRIHTTKSSKKETNRT